MACKRRFVFRNRQLQARCLRRKGVPTGMAQMLCRTCLRPLVTALTQTTQAQPSTAQLHSLSQVHVRSVACNLRTWHVRNQQQNRFKHGLKGYRALCSAAKAEDPSNTRRKVVFLGTPEVISRFQTKVALACTFFNRTEVCRSQQMFCSSCLGLQDCLSPPFRCSTL